MGDWWGYGAADFLLFSPRAYSRMFELHNEALWPLPLLTLAAGLAALALAVRRPRHHGRWIALILAVLWGWVAWSFFWQRYATINWAAVYVAPVFALQAALLALGAKRGLPAGDVGGPRSIAGLLLVAAAIGYPLLAPLLGRPWMAAEFFGIAPDPTAIGTLGFLLLARDRSVVLLPVPLLWCLVSGATLWALAAPE